MGNVTIGEFTYGDSEGGGYPYGQAPYTPPPDPKYEQYKKEQAAADLALPDRVDPLAATTDPRGVMADITRGQWLDFQNTAVPVIKDLQGMTTYAGNTGIVEGLKTEARNNARGAFGGMVADAERSAQSYGMALSPASRGALERSSKLGMAAATTDGVNRANTYQQDLNRQIVAGSSLSTVKP